MRKHANKLALLLCPTRKNKSFYPSGSAIPVNFPNTIS
jgi:hypothetical protein